MVLYQNVCVFPYLLEAVNVKFYQLCEYCDLLWLLLWFLGLGILPIHVVFFFFFADLVGIIKSNENSW